MSSDLPRRPSGFHDGEIAVQRLVGVLREASSLEGMLAPAAISRGMAGFLAQRTFAAITGRDRAGRLWTSPLVAPPGFLQATSATTLRVRATPGPGDPLHRLDPGQPIGLITVDYTRRRRFRINGTLTTAGAELLEVDVAEAFGNCPQYIDPQVVEPWSGPLPGGADGSPIVRVSTALTDADRRLIVRSTGFLLGTTHPERGADVSHRGGEAGFVRLDGDTLWWPDYPGNNLFNSLGNLQVDPEAAVLLPDFDGATALHIHGTAELRVDSLDAAAAPDETGRRVVFRPSLVARTAMAVARRRRSVPPTAAEPTPAHADRPTAR